jgi:hypothetical protein
MACKTETKLIGDTEYSCTQMPPSLAGPIKFQLIGVFGSALKDIAEAMQLSEDKQSAVLISAVQSIIKDTGPTELFAFIKSLVLKTSVKKPGCEYERMTEPMFEEIFAADNMGDMYKVFFFVIQVNYAGFLKGLGLKQVSEIFNQPTPS